MYEPVRSKGSVSRTVCVRDDAFEPTGMYLRRVLETDPLLGSAARGQLFAIEIAPTDRRARIGARHARYAIGQSLTRGAGPENWRNYPGSLLHYPH